MMRHLLLVTVITIISFSQVAFVFRERAEILGGRIYWIGIIYAVLYLFTGYLHLYFLVPHFLMKKNYGTYLFYSSFSILLLLLCRTGIEYSVYSWLDIPHVRESYFNIVAILDNLSDFMLNMICISGVSMAVVLKYWLAGNQRVSLLEQEHIRREVSQVKEQVNPPLLFNVLTYTSSLVKTDPSGTSDLLFRLSQLLRYQLYDCSREKVLLSADITFLENYLKLEQMTSGRFEYQLTVDDVKSQLSIVPFLLLGTIQETIRKIYEQKSYTAIKIDIRTIGMEFQVMMHFSTSLMLAANDFQKVTQRLDMFYPKKYEFRVDNSHTMSSLYLQIQLQ